RPGEEPLLLDDQAAHLVILVRRSDTAPVPLDPRAHLRFGRSAILLFERVPGDRHGKRGRPYIGPASDDGVLRVMELEEEGLASLNSAEDAAAGRLPEVDLIELRSPKKEPVPVPVRHPDVRVHPTST